MSCASHTLALFFERSSQLQHTRILEYDGIALASRSKEPER